MQRSAFGRCIMASTRRDVLIEYVASHIPPRGEPSPGAAFSFAQTKAPGKDPGGLGAGRRESSPGYVLLIFEPDREVELPGIITGHDSGHVSKYKRQLTVFRRLKDPFLLKTIGVKDRYRWIA